jgi:hypothetical protein
MPGTVEQHRQQQIGTYLFVRAVTEGRILHVEYRVDNETADGTQEYDGDDEIGDPRDWNDNQIRELACFLLGIDKRYAWKVELN